MNDLSYNSFQTSQTAPEPPPSGFSNFIGGIHDAIFGKSPPLDLSYNAFQTDKTASTPEQPNLLQQYVSSVKDMAKSSFEQAVGGANAVGEGGTPVQGLEAGLNIGAGTSGVLFSPFAPVINLVSKAIDFAGSKLADTPLMTEYAKGATGTDVRVLTGLQNLGGIAMGILGAKGKGIKAGDIPPERLAEVAKHPDVIKATQDVVNMAKQTAQTNDLSYENFQKTAPEATLTPAEKQAQYLKSQGIEPYTPPEQLPVIDMGAKPKGEPVIQTEPKVSENIPQGTRLVPEPTPKEPTISPIQPSDIKTTGTPKVTEAPPEVKVPASQLPVGTGETKVSRLEARLTNNLDNLTPDKIQELGLATYNEMKVPAQKKAAIDYVTKNPDHVLPILKGEMPAPKGILKESIFVAADALGHEDVALGRKLASLSATRSGQGLRMLAEVNPHSPVKIASEVVKARTEFAAKKGLSLDKETANLSNEVSRAKKSTRSRPSVEEFRRQLSSVVCNF